jgi:hypothetical protein
VQIEDSEFDIFVISVAPSIPLQGSDLVVDDFQLSDADAVFVPVQNQ